MLVEADPAVELGVAAVDHVEVHTVEDGHAHAVTLPPVPGTATKLSTTPASAGVFPALGAVFAPRSRCQAP